MQGSIAISLRLSCVGIGLWVATYVSPAGAQYSTGGYTPIESGLDAYRYHEGMRLGNIRTQLGLIDQMKWYSALPAVNSALGTAAWYGAGGQGYFRDPPSLDYLYATGRRSAYGYGAWGRGLTPLYGGGYSRDIFSPWPYVPGDIYGYQWYNPVPQSIGQRQIQTGPNRWESHPVYASPPLVAPEVGGPPPRREEASPRDVERREVERPTFRDSPRPGPREF